MGRLIVPAERPQNPKLLPLALRLLLLLLLRLTLLPLLLLLLQLLLLLLLLLATIAAKAAKIGLPVAALMLTRLACGKICCGC